MDQQSTFIIVREDLQVDPVTIVADGILVGRLPSCELLLNHPSVSRLHAGVTNAEGNFYIRNLRPGNPITLNGKRLEQYEALTTGDVLGVGPFSLNIDDQEGALVIKVSLQIAATAGEARRDMSGTWELPTTERLELPTEEAGPPVEGAHKKPPPKAKPAAPPGSKALDIFWDKRITAATKMVKPSPLSPLGNRATGKAQSVWTPTTDLKRRWPVAMMIWGAIVIAVLSGASALFYASAFSPAPISKAHTTATLSMSPAIANRANAGSCTACHALTTNIEARCASCHSTDAFVATVIKPHTNAGIGCVTCHAEHRGTEFSALNAALLSCAECHSDNNKNSYKGRTVSTPHGGTLGYPVVDGGWKWKGMDEEELSVKRATLKLERPPGDSEDQWRSKQFHEVHLYRVKAVAGLAGDKNGDLSCSSCHTSFDPIDRDTPRTTCAKCHNGQPDARAGRQVIAADKPNCTSCHIQHVRDKRHWNPSLLAVER
jgi:FHA domain